MTTSPPKQKKRLLVCCDGTWMNSDLGYEKPSIINPKGQVQIPSNVTRISRAFKRRCADGTLQIIEYQSGVGTGTTLADILTGGAFGLGIAEHIREAYSFICANYVDGDEIVLIGFSRGAFTARSIAGMIGDLGLLTREGMDHFYSIFKDMENWRTPHYDDPFPNDPFPDKPRGPNAEETYRQRLVEKGYTRVHEDGGKGKLITVKAVAVWDTVGSLGVPNVSWLSKLGIQRCTKEFYDTALSDRIENAFQALALDEHRPPFSPALWERRAANKHSTNLRQCWFPGNHGNVGGGWEDQGVANMSLAWIMDQLRSIGVEFDPGSIHRVFSQADKYYRQGVIGDVNKARPAAAKQTFMQRLFPFLTKSRVLQWATDPIYESNFPIRPWALGQILKAKSPLYILTGKITRSPGMYKRVNSFTGRETATSLEDTNERIHASVRVRLAVKGLGLDDKGLWDCPALLKNWRLQKTTQDFDDPIPRKTKTWDPRDPDLTGTNQIVITDPDEDAARWGGRWVWEYIGPENKAPAERLLVEEGLGPYERYLLKLSAGYPDVFEFAAENGELL